MIESSTVSIFITLQLNQCNIIVSCTSSREMFKACPLYSQLTLHSLWILCESWSFWWLDSVTDDLWLVLFQSADVTIPLAIYVRSPDRFFRLVITETYPWLIIWLTNIFCWATIWFNTAIFLIFSTQTNFKSFVSNVLVQHFFIIAVFHWVQHVISLNFMRARKILVNRTFTNHDAVSCSHYPTRTN